MQGLTKKQKTILSYIKSTADKNKIQPSQTEVAEEMGISVNAVQSHLRAAEKKGYIKMTSAARSIMFLKDI